MARTHHATAAFRLACGCLTNYNSFPEAKHPVVLCGNCGESVTIDFRYPDDAVSCHVTCRADKPEGGNVKVRCSLRPEHEGSHYDVSLNLEFKVPAKLKSGKTGNV